MTYFYFRQPNECIEKTNCLKLFAIVLSFDVISLV